MIRSVRWTMTRWYVSILAVILCIFSLAFYAITASNLARDVDKTLALQADGIAETIFAFWRAQRASAGSGPGNWVTAPASTFEGEIDAGGLSSLLSRWAEKTGNLDTERPIRFIDPSGEFLGASESFVQLRIPLTGSAIAQLRSGQTAYATIAELQHHVRVVTRPIIKAGRVLYGVQVAASLKETDVLLARLRLLLLLLVPALLVATTILSVVLTTTVLGPIGIMVSKVNRFIAESLHEQMDAPTTSDELQQLDTTFNEMFVRLDRAFRRLRQFSAAASHELRTPLTVMKGEISLALRKPRSAEEYQRVLRTHLDAIDELEHTVNEMLTLAQHEAAEGTAAWHPIDLSALAARMGDRFARIAAEKGVRVGVSVNGSVWVQGEGRLLERLISNLLDNAIKYTPPKGTVSIAVEEQAGEARVSVRDTGAGIPPEGLPHLFDQFFARRPTVTGAHSTGLGLGLCRWIAELHRGQIDVASTVGEGTIFTVRLPSIVRPA